MSEIQPPNPGIPPAPIENQQQIQPAALNNAPRAFPSKAKIAETLKNGLGKVAANVVNFVHTHKVLIGSAALMTLGLGFLLCTTLVMPATVPILFGAGSVCLAIGFLGFTASPLLERLMDNLLQFIWMVTGLDKSEKTQDLAGLNSDHATQQAVIQKHLGLAEGEEFHQRQERLEELQQANTGSAADQQEIAQLEQKQTSAKKAVVLEIKEKGPDGQLFKGPAASRRSDKMKVVENKRMADISAISPRSDLATRVSVVDKYLGPQEASAFQEREQRIYDLLNSPAPGPELNLLRQQQTAVQRRVTDAINEKYTDEKYEILEKAETSKLGGTLSGVWGVFGMIGSIIGPVGDAYWDAQAEKYKAK